MDNNELQVCFFCNRQGYSNVGRPVDTEFIERCVRIHGVFLRIDNKIGNKHICDDCISEFIAIAELHKYDDED